MTFEQQEIEDLRAQLAAAQATIAELTERSDRLYRESIDSQNLASGYAAEKDEWRASVNIVKADLVTERATRLAAEATIMELRNDLTVRTEGYRRSLEWEQQENCKEIRLREAAKAREAAGKR